MVLSVILTVYFWLFLGFVVGFIGLTIFGPSVPVLAGSRDFRQVKFWIARLLHSGYEGGFLRVKHDRSDRSLYFRKYILGKGDYGLELCCDSFTWSEDDRRKVRGLAEDRRLSYRIEPRKLEGATTEALVVDCGQDKAAAYDLATAVWSDVLGLSLKARHRSDSGGCSEFNELIDAPDHPPPISELARAGDREQAYERMRKAGAPSLSTALLAGLLLFPLLISAIGFPVAMLLSRGEVPDWSIELATISFGGDTTALVFLVILVASAFATRSLDPGDDKWVRPSDTLERRLRWVFRALVLTLPFVALLVWAGF